VEKMKDMGLKCRCIRCREVGFAKEPVTEKPKLKILKYDSSGGKEFFLSYESQDYLMGLCRLRIPYKPHRKEITDKTLIVRELHVYGQQIPLENDSKEESQHKGLGKKLMLKAEEIAKENNCNKIVVISGVGVKEYYRNFLDYKDDGPYVSKEI
jgi:elongator complex protein 3